MMSSNGNVERLVEFEANMSNALRKFYTRTRMVIPSQDAMPFEAMMLAEDDGISGGEEGPGDFEMRQRIVGARALLRYLKSEGLAMDVIMKQLFATGRALHDDFFSSLTMTESALMFGETKAAHSWRCKILSGKLKLAGMKGIKLPGQKNPEASESYAKAAAGNHNRRKPLGRQKSFLRKLKINTAKP